ncbi:MAG: diadenylate cyclase CdaA [bacterium]|nr:diadenylate cyclase CdaA [bacterium]
MFLTTRRRPDATRSQDIAGRDGLQVRDGAARQVKDGCRGCAGLFFVLVLVLVIESDCRIWIEHEHDHEHEHDQYNEPAMNELITTIVNMRLVDFFDILLVAVFFYAIFALLRETRSFVALMGFITVMIGSLLLFLLARAANLQAMTLIFKQFWIIVVLIFLIVFQNEFKKALTDVGQMRLFRSIFPSREKFVLDEIIQAVQVMASRNIGALIAFERNNPLKSYMSTGTSLDAVVSAPLIHTVFTHYAPLHDGALIISGQRLVSAGCILPLTDNPELSRELGTRHRAAIGLSEETDAVVVVVSEETGTISVVVDGKIDRGLPPEGLRRRLEKELNIYSGEAAEA